MSGATPPVPATTTVGSSSAAISLKEVANWDGESQEIHKALTTAFDAGDYQDCLKDFKKLNIEPLSYVNKLDKVRPCSVSKHLP